MSFKYFAWELNTKSFHNYLSAELHSAEFKESTKPWKCYLLSGPQSNSLCPIPTDLVQPFSSFVCSISRAS